MLDVRRDVRQVRRMLSELEKEAFDIGTMNALNKTMKTVHSRAIIRISEEMGIRASVIRQPQYVNFRKASRRNLRAEIRFAGKRIPINKLQARQTKRGVVYRAKGQKRLIPGAFIAEIRVKGSAGVYKRRGKERFPVNFLRYISVPYVVVQQALEESMLAIAAERWPNLFEHEVKFAMKKRGFNI